MAQYELNLRDYWRIVQRRKLVILLSTFLVAMFSFWFASQKVPIYQATAAIKFEQSTTLTGLFVEVLSPSTARADRITKRIRFQRAGIPEYWIVDLDARSIERWRPADERPEILTESLSWQPLPAHPPLTIDLPACFARIHGEA